MHDRTSKALGTVETSNHSYQAKAPLKATRTKMNGTFLLKCLAAFCMLGNVTASPTPTCGCSEAISDLRVEFQAKHDAQQALIDSVMPSPPTTFTTKASLQTAVQAYNTDLTAAIATYGPIANWDVSAITDMIYLFQDLKNFNADISNWDTSSVTDMYAMFSGASAFNQPLSFDTSKVTTMDAMFYSANSLSNANKLLIRCAWAGTSTFADAGYDSSWGPGTCPPPLLPAAYPDDLNAWYCPGAFDIASGTWGDCSGNGNTAELSGSGLVESSSAGHGAASDVLALSGTTSSAIAFGAVINSEFTVCSVTRYTGGAKQRILQGGPNNWLHGHWAGLAGVAYYEGWKTATKGTVSPNTDWVVMCGSNAGSQLKLVNGVDVGTATGGTGGQSLFINAGRHRNEKSDFAIAEVVVWPRGLTDEEMGHASDHLINRLG